MIIIKIIYLSLLSASWMSAVSAAFPGGPSRPTDIIDTFLLRTSNDEDWAAAFRGMNEWILRAFFWDSIHRLTNAVDNYEAHLPREPNRDLCGQLRDLPKLVFLMRYYHLGYLNTINQGGDNTPLVGTINQDYVTSLSFLYRNVAQGQIMAFEEYAVDIAVLYAMQTEMLGIIKNDFVRQKLKDYQEMIDSLHEAMARYMQIRNPYSRILEKMIDDITTLEDDGIFGYGRPDIKTIARNLCDAILQVTAIYGSPGFRGNEWIHTIMKTYQAVQPYLVYRRWYDNKWPITDDIMSSLAMVLRAVGSGVDNPPWFSQLGIIVNRLMYLLRRVRDLATGGLVDHIRSSSTIRNSKSGFLK
jgi:hypothetical protein